MYLLIESVYVTWIRIDIKYGQQEPKEIRVTTL